MTQEQLIKVLQTLLTIDNLEIIKCTIESLLETLQENTQEEYALPERD